jgi:hypothetical protein
MRWSVEIANVLGDEEMLLQVLSLVGYQVQKLNVPGFQGRVLHHQKYDSFESSSQVHDDSKNLADMFRRFSEVDGTKLGIQFGAVRQHNPDGSTNRHGFAEVHETITIRDTVTAAAIRNPALSEEEHQKLLAEAAARAEEQKRNAIVRRAAAALQNSRVLEVMELMSIPEPTTTELGHIVDIVQNACGGNFGKYTTTTRLGVFTNSINHPTVFGLGARHAVSNKVPPPKPMTFEEARAYAKGIGAAWLKDFEK